MDTNRTVGPDFGTLLGGHVRRVLGDPSTLHDFRHWFTRALWDAESVNDLPDDIRALAYGIENLLGVLEAGLWTEDDLIAALREEAAKYPAIVGVPTAPDVSAWHPNRWLGSRVLERVGRARIPRPVPQHEDELVLVI